MAHVDHLGRVTTEFEPPDPEKKKGESKISKAMKKLVNWEEDKNQEEMAWKVAEMIPTIIIMMNCLFNLQYSSSVNFKKFEVL
ncbi:uncharacterized protein TNCV_2084731 [Trichonephila clavipes]|uniref:Uncharacterized protein n=1 Tax=Trichonephila clavipes TaxID=2585209 RepID=A0A8X6V1N1_TRICX|nr:uncharacterized protein TNCV_2084731 [Trichonephila clavipes]